MFKRSQITSQVFIYILAIVIFSLILLYGYRSIKDVMGTADKVELLQLRTKIESSIEKTSSEYGGVIKEEFDIPDKYQKVCFVDIDKPPCSPTDATPEVCNPIMADSWEIKDNNLFLIADFEDVYPLYVGKLSVKGTDLNGDGIKDSYFECYNVTRNKIVLKLEGKGHYTQISEWK